MRAGGWDTPSPADLCLWVSALRCWQGWGDWGLEDGGRGVWGHGSGAAGRDVHRQGLGGMFLGYGGAPRPMGCSKVDGLLKVDGVLWASGIFQGGYRWDALRRVRCSRLVGCSKEEVDVMAQSRWNTQG